MSNVSQKEHNILPKISESEIQANPARRIGQVLAKEMADNSNFYFFSPDETTSNRLDAVYRSSARAWNLANADFDLPSSTKGHIIEMLSENTLFACMAGCLISGKPAVMTSYEAFFSIISAQILQHLKFLQQSNQVDWRPDYPAANLLSTSTCWRQDHNGFTHQSPALISQLLALPSNLSNCYFPVDANVAEEVILQNLKSKNVVNLTTFNKTEQPLWFTAEQAKTQLAHSGVMAFDFASADGQNFQPNSAPLRNLQPSQYFQPDFVIACVGDIVSNEALQAVQILQKDLPEISFRLVNIAALSYNAIGTTTNKMNQADFDQIFGQNCPIIANFHGYPATLQQIFGCYTNPNRLQIHGFEDQGSTTTPFEMLSLNKASRYHLAVDVAEKLERSDLVQKYQQIIQKNSAHARTNGIDIV